LILPQVELVQALDCLDECLDVPGISGVLVGPADLSISMGFPGDLDNPEEVAQIERVIAGCQKRNLLVRAIAILPQERLARWGEKGMDMLCVGSETYALADFFRQVRSLA